MRFLLVLLVLFSWGVSAAKTRRDCPDLAPGHGYAGFVLGEKTGKAVQPDAAAPGWHLAKEAAVRLRLAPDGTVAEIEAPLPACVVTGRRIVESRRDPRVFAAGLRSCGPVRPRDGGDVIECEGLALVAGGSPMLRVAKRPAPAVACAGYLHRGEWADASGVRPADAPIDVAARGPVCAVGLALTTKTTPGEARRESCGAEEARGGLHIVCPEAVYSFAGPAPTLTTVTPRP